MTGREVALFLFAVAALRLGAIVDTIFAAVATVAALVLYGMLTAAASEPTPRRGPPGEPR